MNKSASLLVLYLISFWLFFFLMMHSKVPRSNFHAQRSFKLNYINNENSDTNRFNEFRLASYKISLISFFFFQTISIIQKFRFRKEKKKKYKWMSNCNFLSFIGFIFLFCEQRRKIIDLVWWSYKVLLLLYYHLIILQ